MPEGPFGETRPADLAGCAVHVGRIAVSDIEDDRDAKPKPKGIGTLPIPGR